MDNEDNTPDTPKAGDIPMPPDPVASPPPATQQPSLAQAIEAQSGYIDNADQGKLALPEIRPTASKPQPVVSLPSATQQPSLAGSVESQSGYVKTADQGKLSMPPDPVASLPPAIQQPSAAESTAANRPYHAEPALTRPAHITESIGLPYLPDAELPPTLQGIGEPAQHEANGDRSSVDPELPAAKPVGGMGHPAATPEGGGQSTAIRWATRANDRANARRARLGKSPLPMPQFAVSGQETSTQDESQESPRSGPEDAFGSGVSFEQAMKSVGGSPGAIGKDDTATQLAKLIDMVTEVKSMVSELTKKPPSARFGR